MGIFLPLCPFVDAELTCVTGEWVVVDDVAEGGGGAFRGGSGSGLFPIPDKLSEEELLEEASSRTEGKLVIDPVRASCEIFEESG